MILAPMKLDARALDQLEKLHVARNRREWFAMDVSGHDGRGRCDYYCIRLAGVDPNINTIADSSNNTWTEIVEDDDTRHDLEAYRNFEFIAAAANNFTELLRLARIGLAHEHSIAGSEPKGCPTPGACSCIPGNATTDDLAEKR